jgi:dienelactone hydrolase
VIRLRGLIAAGVLALAASCSTGARHAGAPATAGTRPPGSATNPTPATSPPTNATRPAESGTTNPPSATVSMAITSTTLSFTDHSRPVVDQGRLVADYRYLPTVVWRPAASRRWPLVVFVHGYNVGPLTYQRFCSTLASHGYVVAAPSFPLEDPSRGNGLDRGDLPNEAVDVSFVITQLEQSALADNIDTGKIAVAGHSDGADVALMVGYVAGKVDSRVKAIVAYAPDPMDGPTPGYATPLLLIQGSADDVVPYSASRTVFAQVDAPRYYLTLVGAGHLPPIQGGTKWTPYLDQDVAAFLDTVLDSPVRPTPKLPAALTGSSLTSLATGA